MGAVDLDRVGVAVLASQAAEYLVENPHPAPPDKAVVQCLVWAVLSRRIAPTKPVANDVDDPGDHPPIIGAGNSMRKRKIPAHKGKLAIGQPEQIRHGNRSRVRKELLFFKSLGSRFRFHGIVDGDRKMRLLGESKAFLNPVRIEETFGMAPVEAIAVRYAGSGNTACCHAGNRDAGTGFLFNTDNGFAKALEGLNSLKPRRVRELAADRFSIERTAKDYLDLYARILDGDQLAL